MSAPPLDPRLVHPLPAAPHFVGRAAELEELGQLWQSGFRGVVALVGLGGAGKTAMATRFLENLELYQEIGWEGDRARALLLAAEAARQQADLPLCRQYLGDAARWILHSGSVEHLCLLHWVQARAAREQREDHLAERAVDAGLHLARQCGFGLYHIEFLCEGAELCLLRPQPVMAEKMAREAMQLASGPACRFLWGTAAAGHLLGQALAAQRRWREALPILQDALALRWRLGDPRAAATKRLLTSLGGTDHVDS